MDGAETAAAVIAARELGAETVVAGLPLCVGYERELWMLASAAAAAVGCGCELGGAGTADADCCCCRGPFTRAMAGAGDRNALLPL